MVLLRRVGVERCSAGVSQWVHGSDRTHNPSASCVVFIPPRHTNTYPTPSLPQQIFIATPDGQGGYSIPDEPLAWSSPGATLGVKFDQGGNLYIANAPLGLLQVRVTVCCFVVLLGWMATCKACHTQTRRSGVHAPTCVAVVNIAPSHTLPAHSLLCTHAVPCRVLCAVSHAVCHLTSRSL